MLTSLFAYSRFAVDVTYSKADEVIAEVQKPPFSEYVTAWYCGPPRLELAFIGRGKNATLAFKAINPRKLGTFTRTVYLKMTMNKDIELLMKTIDGLHFFQRTGENYLVLPCPPFMQANLDEYQDATPPDKPVLSEEQQKLRKRDRVGVISGHYEGRNGTLEGVTDGRLRVSILVTVNQLEGALAGFKWCTLLQFFHSRRCCCSLGASR